MLVTDRLERSAARDLRATASTARTKGRAAVLATPRMLLALRTTPLLGCAGALVVRTGFHRDDSTLLVLGIVLVFASIGLFQTLRLGLIARSAARGGSPRDPDAQQRAAHEFEMLLSTVRDDDPLSVHPNTDAGALRPDRATAPASDFPRSPADEPSFTRT